MKVDDARWMPCTDAELLPTYRGIIAREILVPRHIRPCHGPGINMNDARGFIKRNRVRVSVPDRHIRNVLD